MEYVIAWTPMMILPWNCCTPAGLAIMTLWGIAASSLVNTILNGVSAGPARDAGEKSESFAVTPRTMGLGVGFGVGSAVGLVVGFAVGLGLGAAVRVGIGVGARVGLGVGDGVAAAPMLAVGAAEAGDASGDGLAGADMVPLGEIVPDGSLLTAASDDGSGEPGRDGLGTAPPQAATRRPTTASRRGRARGIAAL